MKDNVDVSQYAQEEKLKQKFYPKELDLVESSGTYTYMRSVTKRCQLPPGTYVIIPSTYESKQSAKFLLRLFTEKEVDRAMTGYVSYAWS